MERQGETGRSEQNNLEEDSRGEGTREDSEI